MITKRIDIKRAIKERNLTIAEVAKRAGISAQSLNQFAGRSTGVNNLYPIAEKGWGGDVTDLFYPCKVDDRGEIIEWVNHNENFDESTTQQRNELPEANTSDPIIHTCPRCGARWQELPPADEDIINQ